MSNETVGVRVLVVALLPLIASAATVWGTHRAEAIEVRMADTLTAPSGTGDWRQHDDPVLWSAAHQPTPHKIEARYASDDGEVQLFVGLFPQQRQGNEAINQQNKIASDLVRFTALGGREVTIADQRVSVNRTKVVVSVRGRPQQHLVWQWYRIAGRSLTNRYEGKAWEALARIYPARADGAWIAITTPLNDGDVKAADKRLAEFALVMAARVDAAIDSALGLGP